MDGTNLSERLLAGYPVSLTIDHQAMVSAGAATDGSDLAVISERGGPAVSLARVLDPDSSWNRANTKIWFAIDAPLEQGETSSGVYSVVTQDASIQPSSDASKVFLDSQNFGAQGLDGARWTRIESTVGDKSLTHSPDYLRLSARPHTSYQQSYIRIRRAALAYWSSVRVDAKTRFTNVGLSGNCGRIFPVSLSTGSDPIDRILRTGLQSDLSQYAALSYNDGSGLNEVAVVPAIAPRTDRWELHSLTWIGTDISYWRDGAQLLTTQSRGTVTTANQAHLHLEFSAGAHVNGCSGQGELGLEVDWYRVRRFTSPEPQASIQ